MNLDDFTISGFKLLRSRVVHDERRYFSLFKSAYSVEYRLGEVTSPLIEGTPLMIFSDRHHAVEFAEYGSFQVLAHCYAKPYSGQEGSVLRAWPGPGWFKEYAQSYVVDFWQNNGGKLTDRKPPPLGTVLCDQCIITEILNPVLQLWIDPELQYTPPPLSSIISTEETDQS